MSDAPPLVSQILVFTAAVVCVAFIGCADPFYARLSHPVANPITSTAIAAGLLAAIGATAWWQFAVISLIQRTPIVTVSFSAEDRPADYGKVSGIEWRKEYAELYVQVINGTGDICEDLDLVLKPDVLVAKVTHRGAGYKDVIIEPNLDVGAVGAFQGNDTIPTILLASDTGYRLRCARLWPKGSINVIIAAVTVKPEFHLGRFVMDDLPADPRQFVIPLGIGENSKDGHFWSGHPEARIYGERPRDASVLDINGAFSVGSKRRPMSQKIKVQQVTKHLIP